MRLVERIADLTVRAEQAEAKVARLSAPINLAEVRAIYGDNYVDTDDDAVMAHVGFAEIIRMARLAAPENKKWSSQDHRWEYEAQGLLEPEKLADGQDGPEDQAQTIAALTQEVATLKAVNQQWRTWGIIEVAVRNPSVAEYMEHWEGRATKAEATLAEDQYIAEANISLHERLNEAEAALATLRSENERRWISVEERLPDEDTSHVLLRVDRVGEQPTWDIGLYEHADARWIHRLPQRYVCEVTHWQTLPIPPAPGPTSTEEKADGSDQS